MKVVHISTYDNGGAGLAALRIHQSLLNQGIDSSLLVMRKTCNIRGVEEAKFCGFNAFWSPKNKYFAFVFRILRHFNFCLTKKEKYDRQIKKIKKRVGYFDFASPLSSYDLSNHPLVKSADIVHLHWVAGFVDYPSFFSKVDKPIVWTFHDENICLGGFHYERDKKKYLHYVDGLEDEFIAIKRKSLEGKTNIHIVALSKMMKDYYIKSGPCNSNKISVIHNSVDANSFSIVDQSVARKILQIGNDTKVFVFCSMSICDSRKGLQELITALETLDVDNLLLLCIGNGKLPKESRIKIMQLGLVSNPALLSVALSCADYFVMPSFQEAFAQTPLEAMACGIPVIAFPCSGTSELINDENGIRCDEFTVESLHEGIVNAMSRQYDSNSIRNYTILNFSPNIIAKQYIALYGKVLN